MTTYDTNPVEGDTQVSVRDIKPGDTIRLFWGLDDVATVISATRDTTQWGVRYIIETSSFGKVEYDASQILMLATGPARKPLGMAA